ncbi:MAG: 16S rRNA (guanine(966)-N(2))-methyltransferase RsmD [Holosporales bacterium]
MRIVGGSLRGRKLSCLEAQGLRPTADKVRQAIFNILEHRYFPAGLGGLRVLDICAGTGALALEALSRGAASAVCVEADADACRLIAHNAAHAEIELQVRVVQQPAAAFCAGADLAAFDLIVADPPYHQQETLDAIVAACRTTARGVLVVETAAGVAIEGADTRRYGRTAVSFLDFRPLL